MGKTLFSIYIWVVYGLSFAVSAIVTFVVFLCTFTFDKYREYPNAVMMFFGQSMVRINPFWKIKQFGLENLYKGPKGKIMAGNHQSFMDMPLLATLPLNMKWISKKEIFRIPVAGWLMYMAGHISIDRGSKKAALTLLEIVEPIKNGVKVMIFPEGTRSREGKLRVFKKGAFHASMDNNFWIQPIVVQGTYKLMPPDGWKMNYKGTMYVSVLEPISPENFTSVEELTEYVRSKIEAELQRIDALED